MVFTRNSGDKLNLEFRAIPAPYYPIFVRAFLYDKDGVALVPSSIDMTDLSGGRFIENTTVMQNIEMMRVHFLVYTDAGYTIQDCQYYGDVDIYELSQLDLAQFAPVGQSVSVDITNKNIQVDVVKNNEIEAIASNNTKIDVIIEDLSSIEASVKDLTEIEGVLND